MASEGMDVSVRRHDLGQKLRAITDEMRETAFLFQRMSITIQRFNAVAFRGRFAGQVIDEQ